MPKLLAFQVTPAEPMRVVITAEDGRRYEVFLRVLVSDAYQHEGMNPDGSPRLEVHQHVAFTTPRLLEESEPVRGSPAEPAVLVATGDPKSIN